MIKAAIFDVDGTLLDTMPVWTTSGVRYLKSLGVEADPGLPETLFKMTVDMAEKFNGLYNDEYLSQKDKYSYYLDGNHGLTEIASNSEGKGTLLIIKDSYSHCFAPMTLGNYEKVYLVDFRYFNMPVSQFIMQNRVTDILVLYNAVTFATDTHTGAFLR